MIFLMVNVAAFAAAVLCMLRARKSALEAEAAADRAEAAANRAEAAFAAMYAARQQ